MRGHWLDIDHTAVHFGVSPKTVSGWIRKSLLPTTVIEGEEIVAEKRLGTWYIDVDSVKFRKPVADIALADERKRTEAATRKIEEDRGRSRKIEEDRGRSRKIEEDRGRSRKIEELRKANAELKRQLSAVLAEKS